MSSDAIPKGLDEAQRLTYAIGAVVQNARSLEGRLARLPRTSTDLDIAVAIGAVVGLEQQIRRERNDIVHGEPADVESVRAVAQVLRRVRIQLDAIEAVLSGSPDRNRLLRVAGGRFGVNADGQPYDVPDVYG